MKRYGECIYGCDYAGWDKQDWGYYTRKGQEVYMVVFNRPYLGLLKVKVPKGTEIERAVLPDGQVVKVTETARNEYNVAMPSQDPGEPFIIKLQVKEASGAADGYRDALT